ncbi:CDP-glycerol glycerophosphotransferase family protein [Paraliobacillus salinarum]|uniref:CDP-glycerol glycerophosphotransferase family protein n=1 Tax=Paraliobacillus salinarum TaxID=1158996 RepID=UPI0015F3E06E|nr:CDP-glycerol glycerophosphotransferase family protein [Paraliobacillus salinarum]
MIFNALKNFPQRKKTTFVSSFADNVFYVAEELSKSTNQQIVILDTKNSKHYFKSIPGAIVIDFKLTRPVSFVKSIYHIATCQHIFIDTYFGFLADIKFKPNVQCVQLWHAAGAIKKFGLLDSTVPSRSKIAQQRFNKVYEKFNYVVVGSEKMVTIFKESFGLNDSRILRTGIPRTDFFFDSSSQEEIKKEMIRKFPVIQDKKVILYAPTFRKDKLHLSNIELDIAEMKKKLGDEFVFFLKLHPAITLNTTYNEDEFFVDVSKNYHINELLVITDVLITDYSSLPFEFALLKKPMVFFAYDLEQYQEETGLWDDYVSLVPGPVVTNTNDLIHVLENDQYDYSKINQFALEWNQYSKGNSSNNLIKHLYVEE